MKFSFILISFIGFIFLINILYKFNLICGLKNFCFSGLGEYRYNGTEYRGFFQEGLRHGFGVEKYPNGCEYHGFFEHGKKNIYGEYSCESFSFQSFWKENSPVLSVNYKIGTNTYSGFWIGTIICLKGNCRTGYAEALMPEKRKIISGNFTEKYVNGFGNERDALTGTLIYKGEFKSSQYHGQGRLFENGKLVKKGFWIEGQYFKSYKEANNARRKLNEFDTIE